MYVTDYSPLILSLKVAGISTFFVFIFGVLFAHLFSRKKFFGKSIIEIFIYASACIATDGCWFWVAYFIRKERFYWELAFVNGLTFK